MKRLISKKAPKAIGSYSHATQVGNLIYTSGQLPINPDTMELISDDVTEQAKQSLTNIKYILEENESDLQNIIKVTILLSDISDFKAVDAIYSQFFADSNYPSRSAYAVKSLPMNAKIEIEVIAQIKGED
ncbi:Rid family detoxifying hydrolase [Vagococcus bubulae]|uniref:Reactive intermediate/imine deaminase n=1 Tax=Vagococcus bubulae TaxID=1977868 RepID=A0A429ZGJ3_9ENTE|nr:Rid family detoxifying hydrolase [Vagococcus bubulae]RST92816.1 reactive intermediate/imine deaminase [Vagococcus bubulae]